MWGEVQEEGINGYSQLIHVVEKQNLTQHCIAIILQFFKIYNKKKKEFGLRERAELLTLIKGKTHHTYQAGIFSYVTPQKVKTVKSWKFLASWIYESAIKS